MSPYFDEPTNVTNLPEFLNYTNHITGDLFGYVLLMCIFIISFLSMKDYPTGKSAIYSGYITSISAMMLSILGIIPLGSALVPLIILIGAVIFVRE